MKMITAKEWKETPREYKSIIKGKRYMLTLTQKGTALVPVKVRKLKKVM